MRSIVPGIVSVESPEDLQSFPVGRVHIVVVVVADLEVVIPRFLTLQSHPTFRMGAVGDRFTQRPVDRTLDTTLRA